MREATADLKNVKCFWNALASRNKQVDVWINESEGGGRSEDGGGGRQGGARWEAVYIIFDDLFVPRLCQVRWMTSVPDSASCVG